MPLSLVEDPAAGTAWHAVEDGRNVIAFGASLADLNNAGGSLAEFYKRVAWHEMGHAVETVAMFQDLGNGNYAIGRKIAMEQLQERGISFDIWNLFEDVRIEALQRRGDYGLRRFEWPKWQNAPYAADARLTSGEAALILFDFKRIENGREGIKALRNACCQRWVFNRVRGFYNQACNIPSTTTGWVELRELLVRWVSTFGTHVGDIPGHLKGDGGQRGPKAGDEGAPKGPAPTPTPTPTPRNPAPPAPRRDGDDGRGGKPDWEKEDSYLRYDSIGNFGTMQVVVKRRI